MMVRRKIYNTVRTDHFEQEIAMYTAQRNYEAAEALRRLAHSVGAPIDEAKITEIALTYCEVMDWEPPPHLTKDTAPELPIVEAGQEPPEEVKRAGGQWIEHKMIPKQTKAGRKEYGPYAYLYRWDPQARRRVFVKYLGKPEKLGE